MSYLPYFALFLNIALLITSIILRIKQTSKGMYIASNIMLIISILPPVLFGSLFMLVILSFSGFPSWLLSTLCIALAVFVLSFIIIFALGLFGKIRPMICTVTMIFLFIAVFSMNYASDIYDYAIDKNTISNHLYTSDYAPFDPNSLIARLDKPASLHISEDMPIIDGALALYPVYSAFANSVYGCNENNYEDFVQYSNTIPSYKKIVDGEIDIGFLAAPSEDQKNYAASKGKELHLTPIGKEAFVFYVNAKNPIDNISSDDLRKIYSGKITNWSQLGGKDEEIRAYQRNEGSGSQSAFLRFMGNVEPVEPIKEDTVDTMGGIVDQTADYYNSRGAIGFSFRFFVAEMMKENGVKLLSIDGAAPTVENIRNGSYPLTSNFYAVTTDSQNPNVSRFIDWILSEEGQELVERTGYVGVWGDNLTR